LYKNFLIESLTEQFSALDITLSDLAFQRKDITWTQFFTEALGEIKVPNQFKKFETLLYLGVINSLESKSIIIESILIDKNFDNLTCYQVHFKVDCDTKVEDLSYFILQLVK
jgi:hypothetical protein